MVYYSSSKKAACLPSFGKDLISVVGHGHHTTKSARKILVLGGSRHHQSCVLQQQFVAGVGVVEAALTCYAQLLVPTLQAAVAGLRRRPVHLAVVAGGGAARRAPPFLSPLLSLSPSFKNWRQLRRPRFECRRRGAKLAKRPQRPPQKSTQARQSPL